MKLAYYHKVKKRDIVQMALDFNPDPVSKIYIQKDYEDFLYPAEIVEHPKTSINGLAITNQVYHPMEDAIENGRADTTIYEDLFKYYKKTTESKQNFRNLLNACHLRISLDGTTINNKWDSQLLESTGLVRHVILHDRDVTKVREASPLIDYIGSYYKRKNVRLGFKFPVKLYTNEDVLTWGQLAKTPNISNLEMYDLIDDEVLENISLSKQRLTYVINNQYWTLEKFRDELHHIFLQGMFLSRWATTILLKIDNDFPMKHEFQPIVDFFNSYLKSCVQYRDTLIFSGFTYCKYCYLPLQREEKINFFHFIQDYFPEFFDYLYRVEYVTFENNKFIPHLYSWDEIEAGGGYGGFYYRQKKKNEAKKRINNYSYDLILPDYLYLE